MKINSCTTDFKTINISPEVSVSTSETSTKHNTQMEKQSNFEWYLYECKMLCKGILNLDICSPWSEAVFVLNRMKMVVLDSEQSHSSNRLFFSLMCKQPLRHTALLIKCDFELWSIMCMHLPIATTSANSNMTKTALLVKSDFELWSVTCIEYDLWSLTSFAHGQFNLFTTTFNWIYILSQWLVPFNRSLLVTFLNFNFTFLLADFDPLFLFVDRLLKHCTTADAVHSKERILKLTGVVSFGVGKFSIALILGYNGFSAYLLRFHRRCQLTAQH